MQRKKSRFFMGFMVFSMILTGMLHTKVQASTLEEELGIDVIEEGEVEYDNRSKLTDEDSVQAEVYSRLRSSYFMVGTSGISIGEDGEIYITASTYAFKDVDVVLVHLALQRSKDGVGWTTLTNWSKSICDVSRVDAGYLLLVPKGYYYRLHTMHLVIHNDVSESYEGYTNGIMVD